MGSSKTAQALMTKFNYEQKGFKVFLIKPIIDKRNIEDGQIVERTNLYRLDYFNIATPLEDCFTIFWIT